MQKSSDNTNSSSTAATLGIFNRDLIINAATEWLLPSLTLKRRFWPTGLAILFVLTHYFLGGLNSDHLAFACLSLLDSYNENTRRFIKYFFPFLLTGALYDSMRYYYWWGISGRILVSEHYEFEKLLFGIQDGARIVSPPEFFEKRTSMFLDLICGFAYLVFVAEYLTAAFWLFFKEKFDLLKVFGLSFLVANGMGFITYFIFPAAPPWYLTLYGFGEARTDIPANAAAAVRFDQILGTHFFDQIYGRGIDVYGSIPSMHVAYPLLVAWVAWKEKKLFLPALGFYFLMCFSAVYLQHHHIIDIILGSIYALITIPIVKFALKKEQAASLNLTSSEIVKK